MANERRAMSEPTPLPPKPRPAADAPLTMRLAASLLALAGDDWKKRKYGVAVSGGPDSMAMLDLMHSCLPGQIQAATVDHGLRPGSGEEAAMVAAWCRSSQIPHLILVPDQPITGSVQAAARELRYGLLDRWRYAEQLDFVLTAHHSDDQLETLIMRLNRGSGVGGLASIRARQGHVLRPFLQWRQTELEAWVTARNIPFVTDPSNNDPRFDRARLRLAMQCQSLLDPLAAARSAAWLDQADQALEWMVDAAIAAWPDGDDRKVIRDHGYPDELFRRILARRLRAHDPAIALRGAALDGVIKAMREGRRAMVGALLIDLYAVGSGSAWRISAAPRRNNGAN